MFNFNVRNLSQYEKELIAKALHLQPDFITGSVVIDRNEMFLDIPKDMLFTSSNQERVERCVASCSQNSIYMSVDVRFYKFGSFGYRFLFNLFI